MKGSHTYKYLKEFTAVATDGPEGFFFLYIETPKGKILYVNKKYFETETEEEG